LDYGSAYKAERACAAPRLITENETIRVFREINVASTHRNHRRVCSIIGIKLEEILFDMVLEGVLGDIETGSNDFVALTLDNSPGTSSSLAVSASSAACNVSCCAISRIRR
jgi:hypothetical protein